MEKFKILLRRFDEADPKEQFKIEELEVEDKDTAWEIVENNLLNSNTQAWVMNEGELKALKDLLSQGSKTSTAIDTILDYIQFSEMGGKVDKTDSWYNTYENLTELKSKVLSEEEMSK